MSLCVEMEQEVLGIHAAVGNLCLETPDWDGRIQSFNVS